MDTATIRISDHLKNVELGNEKNDVSTDDGAHFDDLAKEPSAKKPTRSKASNKLDVESIKFEESDMPEFYEIIPSLQEIASNAIAVEFWRSTIQKIDTKSPKNESFVFFFENEAFEIGNKFLNEFVPSEPYSIRDLVGKSLPAVRREMIRWADDYIRTSKTKQKRNWDWIDLSYLLCCHWLPNGKIDDRRTALNMLSGASLTPENQFKIMCNYCLEDEIKKLSIDSLPNDVQQIRFKNNPLVYYWICYMKNGLGKYPRRRRESIESYLISSSDVITWPAIEYFWDQLTDTEKLAKALVLTKIRPQFQKYLFFRMNQSERCHVLSTKPFEILNNFFILESCERFAFSVWTRVVNTMSYEKFTELIGDLLTASLPDHFERISWLVKMWDCSPQQFKTSAVEAMAEKVVSLHIRTHWPEWSDRPVPLPCNPDFLLVFLSSASIEFRKNTLFEFGDELVLHNDSPMIDRLMELCLKDAKDVSDFRNYLSKSSKIREYCYEMLIESSDRYDLQQLAGFVTYYIPDSSIQSDFIIGLGSSDFSMESWTSVIELVDKYFEIQPHEAVELKKRIIWAFANSHMQLTWSNYYVREFTTNLVAKVLDAEELKRYKSTVVDTFRTKYKWHHFDEDSVRGFLRWCFDDDDVKIAEFKKSLSVDAIFEYFWNFKKNGRFVGDPDEDIGFNVAFGILDRILLWVFEKSEDVKKYKLKKVNDLCDGKNLVMDENEAFLWWIFEGEREKIREFRNLYSNENKLMEIIDSPD